MRRKLLATLLLTTVCLFAVPIGAQTQQKSQIRIEFKNASLADVLKKLQKTSGYQILFTYEDVKTFTVDGPIVAKDINEALRKILGDKPFAYTVDGKYVSVLLREKIEKKPPVQRQRTYKITGQVMDTEMEALPGASIAVEGTDIQIAADNNGVFTLNLPMGEKSTVVVSYIGMKTARRTFDGKGGNKGTVYISLREDTQLQEVVVTGMFDRRKDSFTGSSTTFTKDNLLEVGNQNLINSLKTLDPTFQITENLEMGSDPNSMPNIKLRGETSFNIQGDYEGNQNQPLFILDGFETTLEKIVDLDMNRVQSVTLLKDAAAKAIYGSKAGNGVVVIQTIRPKSGEMRISYNGNLNIEAPDLTGYNMMNAQEKFDWEVAHNKYDNWQAMVGGAQAADELYKSVYDAIASGVDTYWLSKPLHTGVGQKHTVQLEGGDSKIRYIVGASYNNIAGVMKGSGRNTLNINSTLSYTYKNMVFRNQMDYTYNKSKNSPYGSFSDYISLEPYFAPYDEYGKVKQILGYECAGNTYPVYNPLYNAQLNTKDESHYTTFTDNFEMDWHINENFRFTGRFSYSRTENGSDLFYPASHTMFAEYDANGNSDRKGRYTKGDGYSQNISAQAGMSYNKMLGKHAFFLNGTWNLQAVNTGLSTVMAEGFGNDNMDDISMATSYFHDSHPTGSDTKTREVGFVGAFNYSYADRYLFDASYRATGSSVYGSDNHWGGFWSAGAGWNIHKEKWFGDNSPINLLKLRYSIGYTGTQNFNPYQARAKYQYSGYFYDGRMGATLMGLPNTSLKWQKVMDQNIGIDLAVAQWLTLRAEYYVQNTDNMLTDITLPGSTGFQTYKENMGEMQNRGFELALGFTPWRDNKNRGWLTFTVSATRNKNEIKKIYDIFKKSNDDADKKFEQADPNISSQNPSDEDIRNYRLSTTRPATKFYEGCSMTAIWGVRSLGIDPATGQEMFLDKNDNITYTWNSEDQVIIGDTEAKLHGALGISAGYKGWTLTAMASYRIGGDIYNSTLIDRVENINGFGNLDKRVSETWVNPGDHSLYKAIEMGQSPNSLFEMTKPTSRFVQRNNELYLSSLNIGYDFYRMAFLRSIGLQHLKVSFIANDLLRLTSVKVERGTSYPYARTFSLAVNATF